MGSLLKKGKQQHKIIDNNLSLGIYICYDINFIYSTGI